MLKWNFDEQQGNAIDPKNSIIGTLYNTSRHFGSYGNYVSFNGVNSYIQSNSKVFKSSGATKIQFAIYVDALSTTNQEVLSTAYARATSYGFRIAIDTTGSLVFYHNNKTSEFNFAVSNSHLEIGMWNNVVATWDGTTGNNKVALKINGNVEYGTATTPLNENPSFDMTLGKLADRSDRFFNGRLDELVITNEFSTEYKEPETIQFKLDGGSFVVNGNTIDYRTDTHRRTLLPINFENNIDTIIDSDGIESHPQMTFREYFESLNESLELEFCTLNSAKPIVQTTHELNLLQDDLLQADEVKILNMHEKGEGFNVGITFIPDHALLLASGDIKLKSIGNIDHFKVDATAIDDAEVKMIVSVDEGKTWNAYNGDWHEVEPDADVVLEQGTPTETFNNIPPTAWNELRKFSDTIRFGYLINGQATVHALHSQFDMSGTWKSAYHGEHYDYEYTDNSTMHITLKIDGDYKINY